MNLRPIILILLAATAVGACSREAAGPPTRSPRASTSATFTATASPVAPPAQSTPLPRVSPSVAATPASFRDAVAGTDKRVGAAVQTRPLGDEAAYRATLLAQFDLVVAEYEMKWSTIHPGRTQFDFRRGDQIVQFAEANGMAIRGHTLVWHNALPSWLESGAFTKDQLSDILRDHIYNVVGHYKGRVFAWDVVNEALKPDGSYRDTLWLRTIGPDYIAMAFRWAHEADPGAKLYYNDFDGEGSGAKSDGIYRLVEGLRAGGVPIDGVGLQGHFVNGAVPQPAAIAANMARLGAIGLDVQITELDIGIQPVPPTAEQLARQAVSYRDVAAVCMSAPNCKALLFWGFTDKWSWIPGNRPGFGSALPFDEEYKPKPAFYALLDAFRRR